MIIQAIVFFNFIIYLVMGIALPVVPLFVHLNLGFNAAVAGACVSFQYLGTFLSRAYVGSLTDRVGGRSTVLTGLKVATLSGLFIAAAGLTYRLPYLSIFLLIIGRIILGVAESLVATGAITWGIGRTGAAATAKVISWNGIATYSAIAMGAPLGIFLNSFFGIAGLGLFTVAICMLSLSAARLIAAAPIISGDHTPASKVFFKVAPCGIGLALGTSGFACLATFVTLYFKDRSWEDAELCLTLFGITFVIMRILFSSFINRFGGYRVATVSMTIEALGLCLLAVADTPLAAQLASVLIGAGLSLVFPSLAVEAVSLLPASNRGAAVGMYSLFFDLAFGLVGPLAGLVLEYSGYNSIFLLASLASFIGASLSLFLFKRVARKP